MKEKTITVRSTEREQILIITRELNENADPDVPADLTRALRAMIPNVRFEHGEGNSDAHLLSTIIGTSLSWPYRNGTLVLGIWQGVYFIELDGPRSRKVTIYLSS